MPREDVWGGDDWDLTVKELRLSQGFDLLIKMSEIRFMDTAVGRSRWDELRE